ncbi:MAG: M20 family metallo-hydrolase, partial [Candidatus Thermoplasmatota archaeon]
MEEIYRKIDELKDEMVEVLKNLIRIEAIAPQSGGKGEWEKAEYIESLIKNFGFDKIERHDCLDPKAMHGYRPNIVAEVKGKIKEKIWLVTHMDVVPPGDLKKWNTNPFEPVVKDGKIYGRGSEDNGQDIVSTIYAVKAMRSLGISPENTLGIVIGSDEETGSEKGIKYLLNKGLFKDASGVIVPDGGNADGTLIEIAEKSIMWLKFIVEGKQSHGSMPDKGINAFKAGMRLGLELDKELYKKYKFEDKLFSPPLSTFEPTKKEENVPNINTIPGEDIFYMDCRILPKYPVDKVFSTIEKVKKKIE